MKKLFAIIFSFQLLVSPVIATAEEGEEVCNLSAKEDCYIKTGSGGEYGYAQYLKSITITASGAIGSCLPFCTGASTGNIIPTFSHWIFAGGAIVLLAAEIAAAIAAKEAQEESAKQLERQGITNMRPENNQTDKTTLDAQIVLLNAAREEEVKNKEALEDRLNWMIAVEVVYWLAVAGAATELILYALSQVPVNPSKLYTNWTISCNQSEKQKAVGAIITLAYGLPSSLSGSGGGNNATLNQVMPLFTTLLPLILAATGTQISAAVTTAPGRAITFGVFAVLASIVRDGFQKNWKQAVKNIDSIDEAISAWNKATIVTTEVVGGAESGVTSGADDGAPPPPTIKPPTIKPLPKIKPLKKCLGASGGTIAHSTSSCRNPIKFNRSSINFKSKFLSSMAGKVGDMVDSAAAGDMQAASVAASGLGSNAAKVKKEALDLIKKYNADQKLRGGKQIDFNKEVKAQLANITKAATNAAGGKGRENFGGGKASLDSEDKAKIEGATGAPAVAAPSAIEQPATDLSLLGNEEPTGDLAAGADANVGNNLDDFESSVQDVARKDDVSIFKQLSNRYILNYTKIFDRKKELVPVPDAKTKEAPETDPPKN